MGITKLDGMTLYNKAQFPYGIDATSDSYPHEITRDKDGEEIRINKIRFDWRLTADDAPNKQHITDILNFCVTRGPAFHTPAALELTHITDDDLRDRICVKYKYMKTEFNKMKKKNAPTGEEADAEEEQDDSGEVAGGESLHRSRVKTVC
jgi:hypothetical protein